MTKNSRKGEINMVVRVEFIKWMLFWETLEGDDETGLADIWGIRNFHNLFNEQKGGQVRESGGDEGV